jgi:hypothetical protein
VVGLRYPDEEGVVVDVAPVALVGALVVGAAVVFGLLPFIFNNYYSNLHFTHF